ncbi:MAG: 2-amino-4-hydroxy-6-hydroxymethyldihydropteridine diphosphokinase [Draconibacterium sp.]
MHRVFLGIGGNIGNKHDNFIKAEKLIYSRLGQIVQKSSVYETPPWGFRAEENFWNAVFIIETKFGPDEVLWRIHEIEDHFEKKKNDERYRSREIDIDILYYDDLFTETKLLIIPHPHIPNRKFVLVPLAEIAPEFRHPLLRLTSLQLLENCKDESIIKKIEF